MAEMMPVYDAVKLALAVGQLAVLKRDLVALDRRMTYREVAEHLGLWRRSDDWSGDHENQLAAVFQALYQIEYNSGTYDITTWQRITRLKSKAAWSWGKSNRWPDDREQGDILRLRRQLAQAEGTLQRAGEDPVPSLPSSLPSIS